MQIDDAARGFTYKREGPLDMRMAGNDSSNTTDTAYDLLSRITVKQFTKMLEENSDEVYAAVVAQAVLGAPSKKKNRPTKDIPSTTIELANVVRNAVRPLISPPPPKKQSEGDPPRRDSAKVKKELDSTVARVMQAIRIEVNSEFESLEELMTDLPHILAPGARAVVLTFHSGEDRRVKRAFKTGFNEGIYSSWSRDVVRPTSEERRNNPRSSCCKLRWVVRSDSSIA
jgi:16S rRNA (cytosine1402-N4)-methyltransferase